MSTALAVILVIGYLILAPILGCLLAGIDRKISARMQGPGGPFNTAAIL